MYTNRGSCKDPKKKYNEEAHNAILALIGGRNSYCDHHGETAPLPPITTPTGKCIKRLGVDVPKWAETASQGNMDAQFVRKIENRQFLFFFTALDINASFPSDSRTCFEFLLPHLLTPLA